MARNDLLLGMCAGFLQASMAAAHQAIASATKTSFRMANVSDCVVEQQALLNAQQMLKSQQKALRLHF